MIFEPQISRKPDHYPWAKDFIIAIQSSFWTDREFNFASDIQDFKVSLKPQEREMIIRCLSLIGQVEVSVKTWWASIGNNLPHPSLLDMGYVMGANEVVHGHAYERLLSVLGINDSFEEILKLPIISGRVNYLKKHTHKFHSDNKKQFIYSLILFTLFVENISLFSQFYVISWFGRFHNLLKDTNKQVEYTSREEMLHAQIGIKLINTIKKEHPELFDDALIEKIRYESEQAIKYECEIIDWVVDGYGKDGLTSDILKEFVKDRLNQSLKQIGIKKIFEIDDELISNTEWFDEQVLGTNMSDFFHSKPSEYSRKSMSFSQTGLF